MLSISTSKKLDEGILVNYVIIILTLDTPLCSLQWLNFEEPAKRFAVAVAAAAVQVLWVHLRGVRLRPLIGLPAEA